MASLGRDPCQFPLMHLHHILFACVAPRLDRRLMLNYHHPPLQCVTSGQAATNVAAHWQLLFLPSWLERPSPLEGGEQPDAAGSERCARRSGT
jgi:hypothetical protein